MDDVPDGADDVSEHDVATTPLADEHLAVTGMTSRGPVSTALRRPWVRVMVTTLVVVAALGYILDHTLTGGLRGLPARVFAPTPTHIVAPTETPRVPTPAPPRLLLPPPADCPATVSLESISAQLVGSNPPMRMFGRSPVWVPEGFLPQNPSYLSQPDAQNPYPQLTLIWQVGPKEHPEVTVYLTDIGTGEIAWWTSQGGTPVSQVLTIPASPASDSWVGTPATVAITHAGCYRLDVLWNGGGWFVIFAAGGSPSSH
ncbi:MAG: hypothetical protein ACXWQR_16830 [Ktedonobacterales bacterium]